MCFDEARDKAEYEAQITDEELYIESRWGRKPNKYNLIWPEEEDERTIASR